MKFTHSLISVCILAAVPSFALAQASKGTTVDPATKSATLVVVNGVAIPRARLDALVTEHVAKGGQDTSQLRQSLREELVRRELLFQELKKNGLDRQLPVMAQMEMARQLAAIKIFIANYSKTNPVTEDEVSREYTQWKEQMGSTEYLVRHILVSSDEEAKGVIARLKAEEKFEDIAKKQSRDTGSRDNGGLLAWSGLAALPKSFADAVQRTPKNKISDPVQTEVGWHVLRVEDSRPFVAPSFDRVKIAIRQGLEQKKLDSYLRELKSNAEIKIQ